MRSGDGSIRAHDIGGDVTAHSGDGSIRIDGANGALNVDTGDGRIVLAGKLSKVRARSGDGSVTIRAETGSTSSADWDISTGDGSVSSNCPTGSAPSSTPTRATAASTCRTSPSRRSAEIRRNTVRGQIGAGSSIGARADRRRVDYFEEVSQAGRRYLTRRPPVTKRR